MIRRYFVVVRDLCISVLAVFAFALTTSSIAHDPPTFYPAPDWRKNVIPWQFKSSFPDTDFRLRVRDGAMKWNQVPGADFTYNKQTPDANGWQFDDCPEKQSAVHIGNIDGDGGTLGQTNWCYGCSPGGQPCYQDAFQIKFDSSEDWYKKENTQDITFGQFDGESVATHEFGHATGWRGHYNEDSDSCQPGGNLPLQTMCPKTGRGDTYWRSLEEHDKHTFADKY